MEREETAPALIPAVATTIITVGDEKPWPPTAMQLKNPQSAPQESVATRKI